MKGIRGILATAIAIGGIVAVFAGRASAWQQTEPNDVEGMQVLTQGPIHEAFAEPVVFDPKPGPVVPKAPPAPITERPPDERPEGANVQWIPGYWAWDDARSSFIWVSGIWRDVPPGEQYVPGYWHEVKGGYQWVPGYWSTSGAAQVQYLPEPPASLENGPTSPQPSSNASWVPGMWIWQNDQYQWRPGFWVNNPAGWMWVPSSYAWTPNGYVSNPGYWDYPLANRGLPFAPVAFTQPIYNQQNFQYAPGVALMPAALFSSLFVRPAYSSYYFGDYYAANNYQSGIYPAYAFHGSRYGYDPLYAYAAAQNYGTNPRWADELHETYRYRREHPEARPPHTFAETRRVAARPVAGSNKVQGASNLELARPLNQLAGTSSSGAGATKGMRLEKIDDTRRQEFSRQAAQLHKYREERIRSEGKAGAATPSAKPTAPRHQELPRSPISAAARTDGRNAPPAAPEHPQFDRAARPANREAAPLRHEPQPESRPPAPNAAPRERGATPQPPQRVTPPQPPQREAPAPKQPPAPEKKPERK